ncbi:MAG: alpha/beta hydrolase [Colwellia sp.]
MSSTKNNDVSQVEEICYQLDDIKLAALSCGNAAYQPVLCLHGYLDNAASFLPLMQQLTQESQLLPNRRFIALDWPGHGHSEHRSVGAHYHFFDYVSDLVALFSLNNWQQIDIVAHSMGAMIASAFAAAFPEKVKSLTLIDSFGFICAPIEQTTNQLRQGVLSRLKPAKLARKFTEDSAVKARMYASDLAVENAKRIVQRSLITVQLEQNNILGSDHDRVLYHWRSDQRLRTVSPYRLSQLQGEQLYRDIKCPVQLIYGDQGMTMVTAGLKRFADHVDNLTINKLVGGHHVHMEQPKAFLTLIDHFINKIQTSV